MNVNIRSIRSGDPVQWMLRPNLFLPPDGAEASSSDPWWTAGEEHLRRIRRSRAPSPEDFSRTALEQRLYPDTVYPHPSLALALATPPTAAPAPVAPAEEEGATAATDFSSNKSPAPPPAPAAAAAAAGGASVNGNENPQNSVPQQPSSSSQPQNPPPSPSTQQRQRERERARERARAREREWDAWWRPPRLRHLRHTPKLNTSAPGWRKLPERGWLVSAERPKPPPRQLRVWHMPPWTEPITFALRTVWDEFRGGAARWWRKLRWMRGQRERKRWVLVWR